MTPTLNPHRFRSVQSLAFTVKTLLVIGAGVNGLSLVVTLLGSIFPPFTGETVSDNPMGLVIGLVALGVVLISGLISIATAVCFLIWLHRCYSNLPALGNPVHFLGYSKGWAVGYWFIPFVNLVVPYKVVKEVWEKSVPFEQTMLGVETRPPTLPLWWTLWLISNFASNVYNRFALRGGFDPTAVSVLGVVAETLTILAAILAILIVSDIAKRQEESNKSLLIGKYEVPPSPPTLGGTSTFSGFSGFSSNSPQH